MRSKRTVVSIGLLAVLLSLLLVSPVIGVAPPPPEPERTIKVWKWNDVNDDGVPDKVIEGWLIKVMIQTDEGWFYVAEGRTGEDGSITFTGLPASKNGNYRIWEELPDCWEVRHPSDGWYLDGGYYVVRFVPQDGGEARVKFWNTWVCGGDGCTLTPGYWKTHSEYGPAPYDDTWADLPNGADTPFFASGQSYIETLWTPPAGGNAYYILAHAYIAAELNLLNGASIPADVLSAWNQAGGLLAAYANDTKIPKKAADRALAIQLAEFLDNYNNGYIGPGHCSDKALSER